MEMYAPSGKAPFGGLILLVLIAAIGGILGGGLFYLGSKLVYLIILFPILMGGLAALLINFGADKGKIRSPLITSLFGVLAGLIIYGTFHVAEYLIDFRLDLYNYLQEEFPNRFNDDEINAIIDDILIEDTGDSGFIGYMKLSAQIGVSITPTRSTSTSSGIELGETETWIYWGVEVLIIVLMGGILSYGYGKKPFCEGCNHWYVGKNHRHYLGTVQTEQYDTFKAQLLAGDITHAAALMEPSDDLFGVHVYSYPCTQDCPQGTTLLKGVTSSKDNRGNVSETDKFNGIINVMQANQLERQAHMPAKAL